MDASSSTPLNSYAASIHILRKVSSFVGSRSTSLGTMFERFRCAIGASIAIRRGCRLEPVAHASRHRRAELQSQRPRPGRVGPVDAWVLEPHPLRS